MPLPSSADSLAPMLPGLEGEPLPYLLRHDDVVTCILFLCFFLMVYVYGRGRKVFLRHAKDFFYPARERGGLFVEEAGSERRYALLLTLQSSFMLGLLTFDRLQDASASPFPELPPQWLPVLGMCLFATYFVVKMWLFGLVNAVFFPGAARESWADSYSMLLCLEGVLLFPIVLLVVYFDLGTVATTASVVGAIALVKALLFYKCSVIFFAGFHGFLRLIVYFCALEAVPLLALCKILMHAFTK